METETETEMVEVKTEPKRGRTKTRDTTQNAGCGIVPRVSTCTKQIVRVIIKIQTKTMKVTQATLDLCLDNLDQLENSVTFLFA